MRRGAGYRAVEERYLSSHMGMCCSAASAVLSSSPCERCDCDDEKKRILLVEDNDAHAALICRIFEESEHEGGKSDDNGSDDTAERWHIYHVSGVKEALRWIEENGAPSLIIADYLLPDGNGLDIARCVRENGMEVPFIIMTAYGSERLAVHALKSGAMDYVVKRIDDLKALPWTAKRVLREWENIIQRKKAEEELRKKNRELENFNQELEELLHIISHDLKSPLFSIRSLVRMIIEDGVDEEERMKYLQLIDKSAEKMWNLIDTLLEVAKSRCVRIEYEEVNLKQVIEEINMEIKGLLMRRNAEVLFNSDVVSLKTSKLFLHEILSNLIVNGIIYNNSERPLVEVRCEEREEDYLFSVRDNGVGIPPDMLSKIFDMSYMLKKKRKTHCDVNDVLYVQEYVKNEKYVGSGVGLPQCKRMIRRLGGEIWAESTPGSGSTFFFTIPKQKFDMK